MDIQVRRPVVSLTELSAVVCNDSYMTVYDDRPEKEIIHRKIIVEFYRKKRFKRRRASSELNTNNDKLVIYEKIVRLHADKRGFDFIGVILYLCALGDVLDSYYGRRRRKFNLSNVPADLRTYELCFYAVDDRAEDFIYAPLVIQDEAMVDLVRTRTNGHIANFYRYIRDNLKTLDDTITVAACNYAPVRSLLDSIPAKFFDQRIVDTIIRYSKTMGVEDAEYLIAVARSLSVPVDDDIVSLARRFTLPGCSYAVGDQKYPTAWCVVCLVKRADRIFWSCCKKAWYCGKCAERIWECTVCRNHHIGNRKLSRRRRYKYCCFKCDDDRESGDWRRNATALVNRRN